MGSTAEILIVLDAQEIRKDLVPRPDRITATGPVRKILLQTAQGDRAVDGGASTRRLAASIRHRTARHSLAGVMPVVNLHGGGKRGLQILGRLGDAAVMGSGFDEEDAAVGVRQSGISLSRPAITAPALPPPTTI